LILCGFDFVSLGLGAEEKRPGVEKKRRKRKEKKKKEEGKKRRGGEGPGRGEKMKSPKRRG
jgi:hypothetical protein